MQPACARDRSAAEQPSAGCDAFLAASERARMQWKLEVELAKFEKKY
jgi:hypothetical protein